MRKGLHTPPYDSEALSFPDRLVAGSGADVGEVREIDEWWDGGKEVKRDGTMWMGGGGQVVDCLADTATQLAAAESS